MNWKPFLSVLIALLVAGNVSGQPAQPFEKYTISGYVKDAATGESLIGANIYIKEAPAIGAITNTYGFFSLSIESGRYTVVVSYLGYQSYEESIDLDRDIRFNVELNEGNNVIDEVVISAKEQSRNVEGTEMGQVELSIEQIRSIPAFLGEVDIIKAIQLLPGVSSVGEGNSGFYVRGGGPDQNLVLLDEAVMYNTGHLFGFFSVFNPDAIKNTTLIKGGMPPEYGGRISSVLDVQMKEGNDRRFAVEGGIGLIASRLTAEGPIIPGKASFLVSARRTYALDLAQPFINQTSFAGTNYYFYDFNAKVNYRFSDKDRLFLSGYFGRDVFAFKSAQRDFSVKIPYGNETATLRWNHLFSPRLFMNVTGVYNAYNFDFEGGQGDFVFRLYSGIRDWSAKVDWDYFPAPEHRIKWGINYTFHKMTPNTAEATNGEVDFSSGFEPKYAHESAVYIQDEWKINPRLSVLGGLRYSWFAQSGPYVSKIDSTVYDGAFDIAKVYDGLEPRLLVNYKLSSVDAVKVGVTRSNQYIHLVSNSTSTLPTDVWVPSTEIVKPQIGIQYAIGYFRNFARDKYEASVEVYYKDMLNQLDYREFYVENVSNELEDEFVYGTGYAYGAEFFLRKNRGPLTGWLGYTWSRSWRQFPDIENGRTFPAIFDRPHDISIVAQYALSRKWELGGVFVYGSGRNFTPVESIFFIENQLNIEYGSRNSVRLDDYHRIDFSATYTPKPDAEGRFASSWTFSVYNAYNRRNPFFTYTAFETDLESGTASASAYKVSLFTIIPSVTWNFSWKSKKRI
jgi:hypothetical protein